MIAFEAPNHRRLCVHAYVACAVGSGVGDDRQQLPLLLLLQIHECNVRVRETCFSETRACDICGKALARPTSEGRRMNLFVKL